MVGTSPVAVRLAVGVILVLALSTSAFAADLAGSEWRPTRIGSSDVTEDSKLFVQFKGQGKIAGHGGCNRFFGAYEISGDKIATGPIGSTKMGCPEPVMELEHDFVAALMTAAAFRRDKTKLMLLDDDGNELVALIQTDWD